MSWNNDLPMDGCLKAKSVSKIIKIISVKSCHNKIGHFTSPPSNGTIFEYSVLHITESSLVIGCILSSPKKFSQSVGESEKYCHGCHVFP